MEQIHPRNPLIKPRDRRNWAALLRPLVQAGFFIFIIAAAIRHNLAPEGTSAASIDALCPFGGLETLYQMIVTGRYVPKTHPSNIVLGVGLLIGVLLAGAAFCGWVCPFGSLQDGLTWLRKKLHIPELKVPEKADHWLRYGRFIVLGLILYQTIQTVKLWFAGYDPYRTIFSLGWIFEFNLQENWLAYLIALLVIGASFIVPRAWCKYACPLGGTLAILGHFSLLRIRRNQASCKSCALCDKPCPVGIAVAKAKNRVNTNCIGCLACVETCPRHATLEVQLAPSWWDGLRSLRNRFRQPPQPTASGD
jgi:Pyruvate/2-oxoacid:ferredoxin oxidoreductase delta subunit